MLVALASCSTPPPPKQKTLRSPGLLAEVLALRGEPQAVHARHFLSMIQAERGSRTSAPPAELMRLVPDIIRAVSTEDPKPGFKAPMIVALGVIGGPQAEKFLVEATRTLWDREALTATARALATIRSPRSLRAAEWLTRHDWVIVRAAATLALAETREVSVLPIVLEKLGDEAPQVRWSAAVGLAEEYANPAGRDVLHQMLDRRKVGDSLPADAEDREDRIEDVIIRAANAILRLKDRTALDLLQLNSFDDPSRRVRLACRFVLYQLRDPIPK